MNLRNKMAIASMSIPVLALAGYCSMQDVKRLNREELQKKASQVDSENIPEFEMQYIYADDMFSTILGSYFICRGESIVPRHNVQLGDNARKLAELTTSKGKPFFSCDDVVKYIYYGGKYEYARDMASRLDKEGNNYFYGAQLPQLAFLGLSADEILNFKDTEKPNALMVFPTDDINFKGFEGVFRQPKTLELFKLMRKNYDLQTIVASEEDEVCRAMDYSRDYKTVIITGHGDSYSLRLGKPCLDSAYCDEEKHEIDRTDYELSSCFGNLNPHAVIFLNSCSTANGGIEALNLANSIAGSLAPGRTVIASKVDFEQSNLKFDGENIYPFYIKVLVNGIDQTYRIRTVDNFIALDPILILDKN